MIYRAIALIGVFACLVAWRLAPPALGNWLFVPVWAGASLLILLSNIEVARTRRNIWLAQYLKESSRWRRLLRYGGVAMALELVLSIVLALILLIKTLIISPGLILVSGLAIVMMLWFKPWLAVRIANEVKAQYTGIIARRMTTALSTVLLSVLVIALLLVMPQPNLAGERWSDVIQTHVDTRHGSSMLGAMKRAGDLLDISQKWVVQNAVGNISQSGGLAVVIWIIVYSTYAAFALAFSRLLAGADILASGWRRDEHGTTG